MADENKEIQESKEIKAEKSKAAKESKAEIGKKCAFSGVALRKARRFYRNGLYFRNKAAFKSHVEKLASAEKKEEPAAPAPQA